jgi:hypothetical protein
MRYRQARSGLLVPEQHATWRCAKGAPTVITPSKVLTADGQPWRSANRPGKGAIVKPRDGRLRVFSARHSNAQAGGGGGALNPYPNQPNGYARFLETDDSKLATTGMLKGNALNAYGINALQSLQSVPSSPPTTPATCPTTQTTIMRHIIQTGTAPGDEESGVNAVGFWAGQNFIGAGVNGGPAADEFSEIYMSHWICVYGNGTNLEGHIKFSYFGVANNNQNTSDAGPTQLFLIFEQVSPSGGDPYTVTDLTISLNNQAKPGQVQYDQNMNLGTHVQVGHWHQMENVFKLSSAGGSDGVWNCWLDGTQVAGFTNVQYIASGFAGNGGNGLAGFFGWQCTPWWQGGGANNKTRDDYVLFAHTYMSGIFLRAHL